MHRIRYRVLQGGTINLGQIKDVEVVCKQQDCKDGRVLVTAKDTTEEELKKAVVDDLQQLKDSKVFNVVKEEAKGFLNSSVTPDDVHPEDGFFRDSIIVSNGVKFLRELNQRKEPWFLGIGLKGTHMQYQMPKRFWKQVCNPYLKYDNM